MTDSPRWCATCWKWGDHHTDRHPIADDGMSTHVVWISEPCDCDAHDDHDHGQEIRHAEGDDL